MFDLFRLPKPGKQHLPVLGYTVAQSEYDALKAECDRAHELNAAQAHEIELLTAENGKLWQQLREAEAETAVWRSKYEDLSTEARPGQLDELNDANMTLALAQQQVVHFQGKVKELETELARMKVFVAMYEPVTTQEQPTLEQVNEMIDTVAKPAKSTPRRKKGAPQ